MICLFASAAPARIEVGGRWTIPTRRERHPLEGFLQEHTPTVVLGDIIYTAARSGRVLAVHRQQGYVLWETNVGAPVEGSIAYGRSLVVVGDTQGTLHALNARDGSTAWVFTIRSEWLAPAAITPDRVIALSSSGDLYGLSEHRGTEIWHQSRRSEEKMMVRGSGGPTVYSGEVYQGFADGSVVAYSVQSGKQRWEKTLRTRERFYDVDMTLTVDADSVYAGTFDGKSYKLNRMTGDTQWMFPVGSYGGYTLDGDRVYFSGLDSRFYALNRQSGEKIWETPFASGVGTAPARVGEYLAVTTSGDPLYILEKDTGKIVTTRSLGAGTLSPISTDHEGGFYCLSGFGNFHAFFLRSVREAVRDAGAVPVLTALSRR